jgi:hypothetical protein
VLVDGVAMHRYCQRTGDSNAAQEQAIQEGDACMGTKAGVGMSHHRNPRVAGQEAAEKALEAAGLKQPDFVFMFASVGYDQRALLDAVRKATGGAPLCGSSGEGVIARKEADESNFSVGVMTIGSDELRFSTAIATGLKEGSEGAGRTMAKALRSEMGSDTLALLLFADGLSFNFDRFVAGLEGELKPERPLPLFGGASADNWELKRTYQYCNDEIASDGVACALLSGKARLAWSVNHGCQPIGGERKITRCEGNLIYEIDGKPILEVLKEYLVGDEIDNWSKAVVNLCLGFKAPSHLKGYDEYLIRFMPAKDDKTGSVTIPTEVSAGTSVWMTRRDHEKIAKGVNRIGEEIRATIGDSQPKMVFQFDCAGRGKVVLRDGQKLQLLERLQRNFSPDVAWLGFYTYAEIGPVGDHNCLHNYTAVVLAVC